MDESSVISEETKSLFERYHETIGNQVRVDEFTMKDTQMMLPTNRHYWVGRLMFHKFELQRLRKLRKEVVERVAEKVKDESPVALSLKALEDAVKHHAAIRKIDESLDENELLVEYLTKIESNFRSLNFDLKNIIEILKLETT